MRVAIMAFVQLSLAKILRIALLLTVFSFTSAQPIQNMSVIGVSSDGMNVTPAPKAGADRKTIAFSLMVPLTFELIVRQRPVKPAPHFPLSLTAKFTYSPSRRGSSENTAQLISLNKVALTPGPMSLRLAVDEGTHVIFIDDDRRKGRFPLLNGEVVLVGHVQMELMLDGSQKRHAMLDLFYPENHTQADYESPRLPHASGLDSTGNRTDVQEAT